MAGPLKTIALLGATGSIGGSTLDVVARHPGRFRIGALSAHSRVDELLGKPWAEYREKVEAVKFSLFKE